MAAISKYDESERARAIKLVNDGMTVTEASLHTGISKANIYNWVSREHQTSKTEEERNNGSNNLAQHSIKTQQEKLITDFVNNLKQIWIKEVMATLKNA